MSYPDRPDLPPRFNRRGAHHLRSVPSDGLQRDALMSQHAPRVSWPEFWPLFDWRQSEHVALIGPNGQGKTTLLISILPKRTYVSVLVTKPRDETIDKLIASGYDEYREWLDVDPDKSPRRVIWPDAKHTGAQAKQTEVFRHAMDEMFVDGRWTCVVDEGYYFTKRLKLGDVMMDYWTQGRSNKISFVVGTQRPAWVPVEMYGESTHLFIWRTVEREALRRVSDLGAANADVAKMVIQNLEPHQCLYVNTRTGKMYRTRAPLPGNVTPQRADLPPRR
jgi:energy-coupling factor transporter ATP-binding protein EcfA2